MNTREKYEWTNCWWEEADNNERSRILLIGDSITVGYRPCVQENLRGKYLIDMFTTSKSIDDSSFTKELQYILSEYPYALIHFNNGLHGKHVKQNEYEKYYRQAVNFISQKCGNIILATSTPVTVECNVSQISQDDDKRIKERNEIVLKIARENGWAVDDLYSQMLNKPEYRLDDGYHYNQEGTKAQGIIVAGQISSSLK